MTRDEAAAEPGAVGRGRAREVRGPRRSTTSSTTAVGPTWGHEVSQKAIKALIIFFFILAAYLAIRFEWKMSAAAIVAVIHDIIFTVGVYALFHFQVTPATVTAFLTILGFSLYDTVVVFDKVGEYQRTLTATGRSTYGEMVNRSLNAVLMRSLSTSLVALLPVLSLLIVGGGILGATALEDFALALAAGLFIGSYSSIFVAAPLLAWWKEREPQYRALAERRRRTDRGRRRRRHRPGRAPDDSATPTRADARSASPARLPSPQTIQARPRSNAAASGNNDRGRAKRAAKRSGAERRGSRQSGAVRTSRATRGPHSQPAASPKYPGTGWIRPG